MSGINCYIPNLVCTDMGTSPVRIPTLVGVAEKMSSNEVLLLVWIGAVVGECLMDFRYWPTLEAG